MAVAGSSVGAPMRPTLLSESKPDEPPPKMGPNEGRFAASKLATVAGPPIQQFSASVAAVSGERFNEAVSA